MTTSSEIPIEFLEKHDLDETWDARFTADELRAREMARQYAELGYEVSVVPIAPGEEPLDLEALEAFGDDLDLEHDPLQYVQEDECGPCLEETYVVFTQGEATEADDADVDESLYE